MGSVASHDYYDPSSDDDECSSESPLHSSSSSSSGFQCQNQLVKENHQEAVGLKVKANSSVDSVVESSMIPIPQGISEDDMIMKKEDEKNVDEVAKKVSVVGIKVGEMKSKIVEMEAEIACLNEELSIIRGPSSHSLKKKPRLDSQFS